MWFGLLNEPPNFADCPHSKSLRLADGAELCLDCGQTIPSAAETLRQIIHKQADESQTYRDLREFVRVSQ
jgi:hypothetical protein